MEKAAGELEKARAGLRRGGEGRKAGSREARWREAGGRAWARWICGPLGPRPPWRTSGGRAAERGRSRAVVIFFLVRDLWTRGYDYWVVGLVLRHANGSVRRI